MEKDFQIKEINAKKMVKFKIKEINATFTKKKLVETTGTS